MNLNDFDSIIYINLDHRQDRKKIFLTEAKRVGIDCKKLYRISAYYDILNGARGCVLSHIQALKVAEQKGISLILEDDCFFIQEPHKLKSQVSLFFQTFKEAWDVFFLGGRYIEVEPTQSKSFLQVRKSFRSHAYAINQSYVKTLKSCFEKAYEKMEHDLFLLDSRGKALDYAWEGLQKKDRWYAGLNPMAFQADSYSDIELCHRSKR